jgi:hypothetical protein
MDKWAADKSKASRRVTGQLDTNLSQMVIKV